MFLSSSGYVLIPKPLGNVLICFTGTGCAGDAGVAGVAGTAFVTGRCLSSNGVERTGAVVILAVAGAELTVVVFDAEAG